MKPSEKYGLEIQNIKSLIEKLKAGQVYEIQNVRGVPAVRTIGDDLEKQFDLLIKKLDREVPGNIESAAHILEN